MNISVQNLNNELAEYNKKLFKYDKMLAGEQDEINEDGNQEEAYDA